MNANELMLGNYLLNDNVVVKIDARSIFDIWDDKGLKNYKPIPLTEKWLLDFGFFTVKIGKLIDAKLPNFRFSLHKSGNYDGFLFCENENVITNIDYVHQLQNLHYALTSNPLQLVEPK